MDALAANTAFEMPNFRHAIAPGCVQLRDAITALACLLCPEGITFGISHSLFSIESKEPDSKAPPIGRGLTDEQSTTGIVMKIAEPQVAKSFGNCYCTPD